MTKKVRQCIICGAPTVADNRLCKRTECHIERQKRRIIPIPDTPQRTHDSGSYMSLVNCTHGIRLEAECIACDEEWKAVIDDTYVDEMPSNPRIKIQS